MTEENDDDFSNPTNFEKSISNAMKRFSFQCDILEGFKHPYSRILGGIK